MKSASGDEGIRTPDPLLARQVLSQLSYTPKGACLIQFSLMLMGLSGLEPPTSRLSGVRSNRLSYKPGLYKIKKNARQPPAFPQPSVVVSSAGRIFTVVFGMGTGVSPYRITTGHILTLFSFHNLFQNKALTHRPLLITLERR